MARTIDRSTKMDDTFIFRCTPKDKAQLKLYAQSKGDNVSNVIRRLLIENKIIDPI